MLDRFALQQVWDRTHQQTPLSTQPGKDLAAFAEYIRHRVPSNDLLLDAGCGRGRNALYLAQMGLHVYGCDLSPVAIQIAQAQARQIGSVIPFYAADLTHLPYPDGLFAAAICVHVLPYQLRADLGRSVAELKRVVQADGYLYFDLLDRDDAEYGCGQELEPDTFCDPDGIPIHFSSRQEIDELICDLVPERIARLETASGPRRRVGWTIWAKKRLRK